MSLGCNQLILFFFLEKFSKFRPTMFKEGRNPLETEEWIQRTKKFFRAMECPEEDEGSLATFTFESEVEHWWNALREF